MKTLALPLCLVARYLFAQSINHPIKRWIKPVITASILIFAENAYALIDVGLAIENDLDGNGNITVINGSKVIVAYTVIRDDDKDLDKKDKIQLMRVSDDSIVASVDRGKKKTGTVSIKVKNSEGEQLYVRYVRKTGTQITRTSHPEDDGTPLLSIAKASLADLTVGLNAIQNISGVQPRVIRQIDVQTDNTTRNFGTAWALGATFTTIPDFKAGSLVRISYHFPIRNDSTSWGGCYIEPQISFDEGSTWNSLGSSGYDGGVMNSGSTAIGSYSNTLLIDPQQAADFSVTIRFWHRSYDSTATINGSHDVNNISGTATLMSGVNGLQHFTRVIVEELY